MKILNVTIPTEDGLELAATHRFVDGLAGECAAIILPATGASQSRYGDFASFLAKDGWHTLTLDYRGIGRSRTSQLDKVSMQAWGERDLTAIIEWACHELRLRRLVVVGHSIGGQIIPLARNCSRIDAVLAVAAQKGHWRFWDGFNKYLVYGFFRFYIPWCLKLWGRVPLGIAGLYDLHRQVAKDYARWTLHLDYTSSEGASLLPRFEDFHAPILALSFADDTLYAPKRAVDMLMRHYYRRAKVLRCHLVPQDYGLARLGHSGFFDSQVCPQAFWREASAWLRYAATRQPLQDFRFATFRGTEPVLDKQPFTPNADPISDTDLVTGDRRVSYEN